MKVRTDAAPQGGKRRRKVIFVMTAVLVLTAGAAGFGLTKEKTQQTEKGQKINAEEFRIKNYGGGRMELNPLRLEEEPEINSRIAEYYKTLAAETDFIDGYEDIEVHTKEGQYQDTCVAFVTYGMKIKDIYTAVPGLSTLYLVKDRNGGYQIDTEELDDRTEAYIEALAGHKDVQALMEESRNKYQQAVQSDALLQEALLDLQSAYEDSAGS